MQNLKAKVSHAVHISLLDDGKPLCGIYGSYHETGYPVNCRSCNKAVELLARKQLSNLSTLGLLRILQIIGDMRNGEIRE